MKDRGDISRFSADRMSKMPLAVRIVVAVSLLSFAGSAQTPPAVVAADLVFRGGTVYTADAAQPSARVVGVRGGRIVYVGDEQGIQPFVGVSTRFIDLQGGMLLPGFHDSHVHIVQGGLGLVSCDLSMDATTDAVMRHVAACARENSQAAWVIGRGWQLGIFRNANPTRGQLDAVVSDRPAFFMAADGHSAWVNSRALAATGITASTPDPQGGRIERDQVTGEPTGTLRDLAVSIMLRVIPRPSAADMEAAIIRSIALAKSFGITSVHEANAQEVMLAAYRAVDGRRGLNARVTAAAGVDLKLTDPKSVPGEIARLERLRTEYQGTRFRVTAAKIGADGALEAKTAALLEPYVGGDDRGSPLLPPEVLNSLIVGLDRAKFQVHVHAIGDRATRLSLDAFASARAGNGADGPLHQVAHLQLVDPADIPRFRALGIAANVQGLWAYRDAEIRELVEPIIGPERSSRIYPIGSLARAGVLLVGGSDWSVTSMNPIAAIQVAVTRRGPRAVAGPAWLPDEVVTLDTMLAAYTINGARVQFQEDQVGSIKVGKAADLVVLDRDLAAMPPPEFRNAQVRYTFLEGRQVYPPTTP
jgi:predicted amidohydrolase YtcJ